MSKKPRDLDELIGEAKDHLAPNELESPGELDWSKLESRLMAETQKPAPRSHSRTIRYAAFGFAAAAAFFLVLRSEPTPNVTTALAEGAPASQLESGELQVRGTGATKGHVLRSGDPFSAQSRAVFERAGKVSWLAEPNTQAKVKAAGESLVLGLEDGVIEAQVVPVPIGEAFAVDIATERGLVRVAVHGTHLRVERVKNHVVVDLTEGVISIGVPPRTGVTYGKLVTAPAHVELDATDLDSIRVDHDMSTVRAAVPLGPQAALAVANVQKPEEVAPQPLPNSLVPNVNGNKPAPPSSVAALAPKPEAPIAPAAINARDAIIAAVRDCAATRSRPGSVRVTVTSNLKLQVGADGTVKNAQFTPPLQKEVQECAAPALYRHKLEETGVVTIPIEYSF